MESSTADSATDFSVEPLVFRMTDKGGLAVEAVCFLGNEGFSHED